MLGSAWVPLSREATRRLSGRAPAHGQDDEGDSSSTLQAVAMAAAMMRRTKFVTVNMAKQQDPIFAGNTNTTHA